MIRGSGIALLLATLLLATACSGNVVLTRLENPAQVYIDLPYPDGATTLVIAAPAGQFDFTPGGQSLVSGSITYNLTAWEPRSSIEGGTVRLEQTREIEGVPPTDSRNDWTLALGSALPYSLEASFGAGSVDFDLSGLPLTALALTTGAGDVRVDFDAPNPQRMERFRVDAGGASVLLAGLLNANFDRLEVAGGAGQTEVRFEGGPLAASSTADIRGGVGQLVIVVDLTAPIRIEPTTGIGGVVVANDLVRRNDGYETPAYAGSAARLDVTVNVGVGQVRLETD